MHWLRKRFIEGGKAVPMLMEYESFKNLVSEYVIGLETGLSEGSCLCSWIMVDTNYGKRKVKGDVNFECPVHTKEGMIIAFIRDKLPNGIRIVGWPEKPTVHTMVEAREWKPDATDITDRI